MLQKIITSFKKIHRIGGLDNTSLAAMKSQWERIYHVHVRKTGGTSLNHMFLALAGEQPVTLYERLVADSAHRVRAGGLTFVGWNPAVINQGSYFYAFSHIPFYELELPPRTFTFTCFRDPVRRVLSHYEMLVGFKSKGIQHPCMEVEGLWLGANFDDFLKRIPDEHLLNQLHMFSKALDIEEAFRVARSLDCFIFNDDFDAGVERINTLTGLGLVSLHVRKQQYVEEIQEESLRRLQERLSPEYRLLEMLRNNPPSLH